MAKNQKIKRKILLWCYYFLLICGIACKKTTQKKQENTPQAIAQDTAPSCCDLFDQMPNRFGIIKNDTTNKKPTDSLHHQNMVWIPAGTFLMGGIAGIGNPDELPAHKVKLNGFWIDRNEVTNEDFAAFVKATGHKTTAEIAPDWEAIKKTLPAGTPKPHDSMLVPSAMVFSRPKNIKGLNDFTQWWRWVAGADWQHPTGKRSHIKGMGKHPVVQVSLFDAKAYCKWKGKKLPTEAQWEYAARGGLQNKTYPWGNEPINHEKANYWQGNFPLKNENKDGYVNTAPVRSFPPNMYGLYDMSGNVWEWCSDLYDRAYYASLKGKTTVDPQGATNKNPQATTYVIRGGSYLCSDNYCTGYRVSARMQTTPDSSTNHIGFRCVR